MKLFGRACIVASLVVLPFACSSDEDSGSSTEDAGAMCGDGVAEGSEDCDGTDLGGGTCASATMNSMTSGTLGCTADCEYDTTDCSGSSTGGMSSTGGTPGAAGMGMAGTMGSGGTMSGGSDGGGDTTDGGDTGGSSSGGSGGDSAGAGGASGGGATSDAG